MDKVKENHLRSKWMIKSIKADFKALADECGIDMVIARVLVNRGIDTPEKIKEFLDDKASTFHDAMSMKDMDKAVAKIEEKIRAGAPIVIAADYDVDGIFSGELLYRGLMGLGAKVSVKTPDRIAEGYGVNKRIVDEAKAEGAGLIVTCDNGIAADEIAIYSRSVGIDFIVTDHHEIPFEEKDGKVSFFLPEALAVVDPKRPDCDYPFKGLCGCGVALKLIELLYKRAGKQVPDLFYEYSAIATVADVVPVVDENRAIVKKGLSLLQNSSSIGLKKLFEVCGYGDKTIISRNIGYVIAPCFNAAGRLESTDVVRDLLRETDEKKAEEIALHLYTLNASRKDMTEEGFAQVVSKIENSSLKDDKILLVKIDDVHESLCGIIAGRLRERYYKPAIVFAKTEWGLKGSARSTPEYNLHKEFTKAKDLLMQFGGHAKAAGLSVSEENYEKLREFLNRECTLTEDDSQQKISVDVAMPIGYISFDLINQLSLLEPFGEANRRPIFAENGFKVNSARVIGKNQNVLRLQVENQAHYKMVALLFHGADTFIEEVGRKYGEYEWTKALDGKPNAIDATFAYYPQINEYLGTKSIQLEITEYKFR